MSTPGHSLPIDLSFETSVFLDQLHHISTQILVLTAETMDCFVVLVQLERGVRLGLSWAGGIVVVGGVVVLLPVGHYNCNKIIW